MFEDKTFLYNVLPSEWEARLREAEGIRLPGPLHMQVMEYGSIDDMTGEEIVMRPDSPLWTFVIIRVIGPAMHS